MTSSRLKRLGPGVAGEGILGRVRALVREVLHTGTTPTRTAASLAVGLAVGLSPLLGFHTLIVILVAFLFGLNRIAAILASCIFNPWTAVPIVLLELKVGALCLGHPGDLPKFDGGGTRVLMASLAPYLADYVVGAFLVAAGSGSLAFPVLLLAVKRWRRLRDGA